MANVETCHKLKSDVKDFIETKIKDVKCVDDIIPMYGFKIPKPEYDNDANLYLKLYQFKKILQLTINVFNNFEVYKDKRVKFISKNKPMDFYHVCDTTNGLWECVSCPEKSDIEEALYNYVACFLSIEMHEIRSVFDTAMLKNGINQCPFCDFPFSPGDYKCSSCDSTLEDILSCFSKLMDTKKSEAKTEDYVEGGCAENNTNNANVTVVNIENLNESKSVSVVQRSLSEEMKKGQSFEDSTKEVHDPLIRTAEWKEDESCNRQMNQGRMKYDRENDVPMISGEMTQSSLSRDTQLENVRQNGIGSSSIRESDMECASKDDEMKDRVEGSCTEEIVHKWKCGKCGYFNLFSFLCCKVCDAAITGTEWICGQCTLVNNYANDKCETCGSVNDKGKTVTNDGEDKLWDDGRVICDKCGGMTDGIGQQCGQCNTTNEDGWKDTWECGQCRTSLSYKEYRCTGCRVERMKSGKWKCGACTFVNSCNNVMCAVCNTSNDRLVVKMCKRCNKSRVMTDGEYCVACITGSTGGDMSVGWRCKRRMCIVWNNNNEDYCHKCKIWRHSSHNRGDPVQQLINGGRKTNVWICDTCGKANELTDSVCKEYKCHDTRYAMKQCTKCKRFNDGTLLCCDKCHQHL